MRDDYDQTGEVRAQAAEWFARLKDVPVSRETLEQFFEWRKIDSNGAAFDAVERFWAQAGTVADSPRIVAAVEAADDRGHQASPGRRSSYWGWAAGLVAVALSAGAIYHGYSQDRRSFTTKVGERREVALEDGSRITLDTDTKLDVHYSDKARSVTLERGQAYFQVAHRADRPFRVEAGGTAVLATGTQFEVRKDQRATEVTLLEGRVLVTPSGGAGTTSLTPGQRLAVKPGSAPSIRTVDGTAAVAWKRGQIVLDNRTLSEAVDEINRYTDHPVRLDSPRYADDRLSGSFAVGDVNSFVEAATALLPVHAVRADDGTVTLVDRTPKAKD